LIFSNNCKSSPNQYVYVQNPKLWFVDIYSSKFALIIMAILIVILVLQVMNNASDGTKIDSQTCELYIEDSQFGGKKYLNEYDQKCLDFKNLNP